MPSGNFGNIYAGHVARRMGLPIRRLILATNENDVLDEFFRTGRYRVRARGAHATSSPSMDISKASNFERYIFDLVGREGARVKDLWRRLDQDGEFDLSRSPDFAAVRSSPASSRARACTRTASAPSKLVYERFGVVIDPHTADGVKVGLRATASRGVPLICLETALPAKFAATIRAALGRVPERPAELADLEKRPQRFEVVANDPEALKRRIEAAL